MNKEIEQIKKEAEQQGVVFHTWEPCSDGWGGKTYGGIMEIGNTGVLRKVKAHACGKLFVDIGAGSVPFDMTDFQIVLKAKAKTNSGKEHTVRLEISPEGKWALNILGTPGKWYVETLRESDDKNRESLSIHGNDWIWVNFQEVMEEANSYRGVK